MDAKRKSIGKSLKKKVRKVKSKNKKDPNETKDVTRGRRASSRDRNSEQYKGRRGKRSGTRGRSGSNTSLRGRSNHSNASLRGRSNHSNASLRGRSNHSNTSLRGRSRSTNPARTGPPRRQPPARMRSFGHERLGQNRNNKQKLRLSRSMSPSLRVMRSASTSPSRQLRAPMRGRSADPGFQNRNRNGRSRSRSLSRFSDERMTSKEYPSQNPKHMSKSKRRLKKYKKKLKKISHIAKKEEVTWSKVCQYIVPIFVLLGASIGLFYATGNGDIIDGLIADFDNSLIMDPFGGSDAPHWPENGKGLRVTIINALTSEWHETFDLAVKDWNSGEPDAIEITEEKGTYDPECEAPDGKVIVCNGDYGDSKWRGVNEAMLNPRGKMVSSSARMNEYYLFNMGGGAWQYTMCHEIGHTLGLGHTDEIFDNPDLGNCMDYTDNLNANKQPDKSNYEKLLSIYGPIPSGGRQRQLRRNDDPRSRSGRMEHVSHLQTTAEDSIVDTTTASNYSPQISVQRLRKKDPSNKDSRPKNDDTTKSIDVDIADTTVPDHIRSKKKEAVQKLFQRLRETHGNDDHDETPAGQTHKDGWKLVHRKHLGEEHETELGEGYKVRVQFLLVH